MEVRVAKSKGKQFTLRTPWGKAQAVQTIADGIWRVTTAGHGGFKLDRSRNAQVPADVRQPGGWYEEDCEWAHVAIAFPSHFSEAEVKAAHETRANEAARAKRDAEFAVASKGKFVGHSAWGDWHPRVPKGKVGCWATKDSAEGRFFLVSTADWAPPYVINETAEPWSGPDA